MYIRIYKTELVYMHIIIIMMKIWMLALMHLHLI